MNALATDLALAAYPTACDREPIHLPGAVQYGLLLVVDPATDLIAQAAGDAESLLGHRGPVLGEAVQDVLGASLAHLLRRAEADLLGEPTYLGTVGPFGHRAELTVTAHAVAGAAVLEVEPAVPPATAAATLGSIRSSIERIGRAGSLLEACGVAAQHVKRITGYARVMVYRFHPDGSGSVIAEARDDRLGTFLNHRFPAADIPRQRASCTGTARSASSRTWATSPSRWCRLCPPRPAGRST